MKKRLLNLQTIQFENDESESKVMWTRFTHTENGVEAIKYYPTDFSFLDMKDWTAVCEVGPGWGRNAPFWGNPKHGTENVKFFGFDASPTSVRFFKNNSVFKFDPTKQYVSNDIDDVILAQKYDFIYTTVVLNHIGFYENRANEYHGALGEDVHDSISIFQELWPTLKVGGKILIWECIAGSGQNDWDPQKWLKESFDQSKIKVIKNEYNILKCTDGTDLNGPHQNIILEKVKE